MLERIKLLGVGPEPGAEISFRSRMNLLAGDNGLGKSFLLDIAWWVLTRTWSGHVAVPHAPPSEPRIHYRYGTRTSTYEFTSEFDRDQEKWSVKHARPPIPGLVLYAQADGGFSVWDPERNYWKKDNPDRPPAFLFSSEEVWSGMKYCEGLVRDWASWQRENAAAFGQLRTVLKALSPSHRDAIAPGALRRISTVDPKDYPTLQMGKGEDVAVIHASAGMRRIVALAYLLVWTWREHLAACEHKGAKPARQVIFLVDELEAHLHPQWQRRIVPALMSVMQELTGKHDTQVQLIAATHSPLFLASVEPDFNPSDDGLFRFEFDRQTGLSLEEVAWSKQGDVVNWLVSETFGLQQGRSLEAEAAIEAAEAIMRGDTPPTAFRTRAGIDAELQRVLAGHDAFWPRWIVWREKKAAGS